MAFHPSQRFVYVLNELRSTMAMFAYDGVNVGDVTGTAYALCGELVLMQGLLVGPPVYINMLPPAYNYTNQGVLICASYFTETDPRFLQPPPP